jgi:hypothetical protein
MGSDPKEYLVQVMGVDDEEVILRIDLKERGHLFSLPREMCPEEACVTGGSFFFLTQGVGPIEERKLLTELLGN